MSTALKIVGWIIAIVGLIGGFYLASEEVYVSGATLLVSCVLTGLLFGGLGEIVEILDDMRNEFKRRIPAPPEPKTDFWGKPVADEKITTPSV